GEPRSRSPRGGSGWRSGIPRVHVRCSKPLPRPPTATGSASGAGRLGLCSPRPSQPSATRPRQSSCSRRSCARRTRPARGGFATEAALALRDKAALMDLPVGIGIAVGPAVVARAVEGANVSVLGSVTNLAARLQTAAAGGEILLSDEAYRRVESWLRERGLGA